MNHKISTFLQRGLVAAALVAGCGTWAGAQQTESEQYVPGQVIVKFKSESGVVMKVNAKGRFATSSKMSLDNRLNELGIESTDKLMPLTGALSTKNKAPQRRLPSGRIIEKVDLSKLYCLKFDNDLTVEEMIDVLAAMPEVEYAEPNHIVHTCAFETDYSSDPLYSQQWALNAVNLPQLWQMPAKDTRRPVIAILDTGVDINHPDLKDNIWINELEANGAEFADDDHNGYYDDLHGWDFVKNTAIINEGNDLNGHGTHCAGIAAACGNNGIGIVGANPDALIMPIRVLNANGVGDVATSIRGIDYAVASGADVISMSYGSYGSLVKSEYEALLNASFNAVCVAAAGNDGLSIYDVISMPGGGVAPANSYPSSFEFVIGVMSSDRDDTRSNFSNFDPDGPFFSTYSDFYNYDIYAPGESIISTYPGGGYKSLTGTSMSTPLVAGAISRMLQIGGYQKIKEYGFLGDIAMSRKEGTEVFDALKALTFNERTRETAIVFSSIEVNDHEFGDGDGNFDAGEIVDLYPVLRSVWGQVDDDIILSCTLNNNTNENTVEFINNNVEFGYHLNSRGSATSKNPIRIRIANNVNDGYNLQLIITAKTADKVLFSQEFSFSVSNMVDLGGILDKTLILYPNTSYFLNRDLILVDGAKLIINPGVTIISGRGGDMGLSIIGLEGEKKIEFAGSPDNPITIKTTSSDYSGTLCIAHANLKNVYFENSRIDIHDSNVDYCVFKNCTYSRANTFHDGLISNCNFINYRIKPGLDSPFAEIINSNIFNDNSMYNDLVSLDYSSAFKHCNIISKAYSISSGTGVLKSESPSYWGSANEKITRKNIFDIEHPTNPTGSIKIDLSNMLLRPVAKANGIVWKVCVNGYDAQDEYENLLPLGVGKHKFEVYFNRQMKHDFIPEISMGLQKPFSQTAINQDGFWRVERFRQDGVNIKWTISDPEIVTWGGDESITANKSGKTTITASESGIDDVCEIIVDPNAGFRLDKDEIVIAPGEEISLFTKMIPDDISENDTVVWSSLIDAIATVDQAGNVKGIMPGKTEIAAKVGNYKAICIIEVRENAARHLNFACRRMTLVPGEIAKMEVNLDNDDLVDVYTAYLTIKGSEGFDGKNRISVSGARDENNFEIPIENIRFNVMVQAAGAMSSGFMAETGAGNVKLTWENPEENFDDMLGYNMYRYTTYRDEETGKTVSNDTIRINERLLDTEEYIDYDVVPGTTYYYYYKVMRTNFEENSPSKVVAATPRAAGKGDANASGNVDVADVVTEVNYMVGRDPKPFIFDAADVNDDKDIDILDVVGTVNIIMAPVAASDVASVASVATYTIIDGILYVDSPVELAGVQAELSGARGTTEISVLDALRGMENTGDWISDESYRFIAFSLSGKTLDNGRHALLSIGDASLSNLILVDTAGNRVMAIDGSMSGIGEAVMQQMKRPTPNPFVDVINVPVIIGTDGNHAVELSMHNLSGVKVLSHRLTLGYGEHNVTLNGSALNSGFYMLTLTVDGSAVQTHKVIKK